MATEMLFTESKIILGRESSYGTDVIDLQTNKTVAQRYEAFTEVTVTLNSEFLDRAIRRPSFTNNRGQFVRKNLGWAINGIVPAPATAGNSPLGLDHLLVASGMTEALVADTTATYTLSTTATAGLTAYYWQRHVDAYVWRFIYGTGIRGNMTISGSVGQFCTFAFTGESNNYPLDSTITANPHGWSVDLAWFDTDGTILLDKAGATITTFTGVETMDDPNGLYLEAATITVDSVAFPCSAFSIDHGNAVTAKQVTSSAPTVSGVFITGRNVSGEFTLEDTGAAFEKAIDILHSSTEVAATIVLTDRLGSGGTTLTITMGDLQLRSLGGPTDSGGLAAWTLPFQANGLWSNELGDNELSYVWSVTA